MIISSRMERQLSIAATALLTAAIFVMPIKTRTLIDARDHSTITIELADATPLRSEARR